MSRKPIIAGNWKMHNNCAQSVELIQGLKAELKDIEKDLLPEVVVAPVFTSLYAVDEELKKCACGKIKLAAQNCFYEEKGAYTGEIAINMLKDFDMSYIIIGHSERRQYFSESDEMINKKAKAILANGLLPIICCGETLEQREQGITDKHIASQITKALDGEADGTQGMQVLKLPQIIFEIKENGFEISLGESLVQELNAAYQSLVQTQAARWELWRGK